MEKYDAILKTINDKIADQEGIIKMYRKESAEKDATIRELKGHIEVVEAKLKELSNNYDKLYDSFDKKLDEISELKTANAKLTVKINELEKF
jgi:chromosome segregation ATPase